MTNLSEITLGCGTSYPLDSIQDQGISFIPFWENPEGDEVPMYKFAHLWGERRQITPETFSKKSPWDKRKAIGVQIFTGKPTFRNAEHTKNGFIHLVDIDIEHLMASEYPDTLSEILETYNKSCDREPCIIITKRGGIRLSCFSDYCGPKFAWRNTEKQMLIEIHALHGMSKVDKRYSQNRGSLLNIPEVPKTTLQEIYHIAESIGTQVQAQTKSSRIAECQIQNLNIQWREKHHGDKTYNVSQLFPTEFCQNTTHISNRNEVRFTAYGSQSISGFCFNCGEAWWEVPPKQNMSSIPSTPQKYHSFAYQSRRRYK
ncbi:hypothetical protein F4Z99_07950 [Candidatus Poribacteria bacterium]|nr:hypothetical protein [Candidatus Poribacteria bacterium]